MKPPNLKVIKEWQISQNRESPVKEAPIAKSDEQTPTPIRKALRLDVDEILRQSLPKVSSQSRRGVGKEIEE